MSKFIKSYNDFIKEGITKTDKGYSFDFSKNEEDDLMSLHFTNRKSKTSLYEGVPYSYYFAYEFDNNKDKELLKYLKTAESEDVDKFVKKAVIGFDNKYDLSTFDTIVYPKSSSLILKKLANQCYLKSGNATLIPDSFIKVDRMNIEFDYDKINNLPESTKKQVLKTIDKIKSETGEFKLKEVFSRFRKFIFKFIKFNSENDRRITNSIVDKKVLLIDDYRTSGTTLKVMKDQLLQLKPKELVILILVDVK